MIRCPQSEPTEYMYGVIPTISFITTAKKKTSENGRNFCQSGEQSSAYGSDKHFNLKSDPTGVSDPEACTLYWHC